MHEVVVEQPVVLPPDQVYALVADMEAFPRFMPSVRSVRVLSRSADGRRTETEWSATLSGTTFTWVEEDLFLPEEGRIAYRLLSGDLKRFDGEWRLVPHGEGTLVSLSVRFEFGLPMLAAMLNPVAKVMLRHNVEGMLRAISQEAARKGEGASSPPAAQG